ncbi:MAG TPA: DUF58 domain-containing protein [Gemmataceae bacterium]|nr:DUF58 domain-containing protein [Gemmataceae bacterium]
MITARGWWCLVVILAVQTLAVLSGRPALTLVALTLLLWFLGQWLLFAFRVRLTVPTLQISRQVRDGRGPVDTLWAGRVFQVQVELRAVEGLALPCLRVADQVPFAIEKVAGSAEREGSLTEDTHLTLDYSFRAPAAGRVRFGGVAVEIADFQGFYYHALFVAAPHEYNVLPPLADARGHRPTIKRNNLLPSPGLHRHLRPGSGSELLDLRDYLPGDPPKTIAWKVSARRDRLITKEFESEVPVRCTLFLDTSQSVRLGLAGHNALARQVEIAAAVAQAAGAARDLTGACLFDEQGVSAYVRPARGARHLVQLLNLFAKAAGLAPATGETRVATLLPLAYALAEECYPELVKPAVNRTPWWLFWICPPALEAASRASKFRRVLRWMIVVAAFLPLAVAMGLFLLAGGLVEEIVPAALSRLWRIPEQSLDFVLLALAVSGTLFYFALVTTFSRAILVTPRQRRMARWRKRVAAIVSVHHGLDPGGLSTLLEDDKQFAWYVQRFLADHQVPYPVPLYDHRGRYLFRSPGKTAVLARALLRSVGKGRDNELYVLLVDLLELGDQMDVLLRAVRVTLARHHQVMVICPWPPGIPLPGKPEGIAAEVSLRAGPQTAMLQATTERLHRAFDDLRQTFARIGVPIVCASKGDPVRLILTRLDRLRLLGLGRKP